MSQPPNGKRSQKTVGGGHLSSLKQEQPLPKSPKGSFELKCASAATRSAAICRQDLISDPINYWVGMWGKVLILVSAKRQGIKQQLNPETDVEKLQWDVIFREVFNIAPSNVVRFLTAKNCSNWLETRIRKYKERFPKYRLYGSAIDELVHHYSQQLSLLAKLKITNGKRLYWENIHSFEENNNEIVLTDVFKPGKNPLGFNSRERDFQLMPSSFSSFVYDQLSRKKFTATSSQEFLSQDTSKEVSYPSSELVEFNDENVPIVDQKRQLALQISNNQGKRTVIVKIFKPDVNTNKGSSVSSSGGEYSGHYHAVFSHNAEESQHSTELAKKNNVNGLPIREKITSLKRILESSPVERSRKRIKLASMKQIAVGMLAGTKAWKKALLLSKLYRFKFEGHLLWQMSWIVSEIGTEYNRKNNGQISSEELWHCPFLLQTLEDKIHKSEITDLKTLMFACRCLVALYVLITKNRIISSPIANLQKVLKAAT